MAVLRKKRLNEQPDDTEMLSCLQIYKNVETEECEQSFSSISSSLPSSSYSGLSSCRSSKRSPTMSPDLLPKSKVPKIEHIANPVDQEIEKRKLVSFKS